MIYSIDGHTPEIASGAYVAESADIIGQVLTEAKSNIWPGAVLRGDIEQITVREFANIQDLSVIHTDEGFPCDIGQYCTVGHGAILHGCMLEEGVMVGMGAIIMNGTRIGRGSVIGAGAVVTERQTIPPFSLVLGMPGKVKTQLDPASLAERKAHAMRYAERGQRYLTGLKQVPSD